MDQIVNHAARWHQLSGGKVKVPLVVRTQGGVGFRNSSQHSQSLENWFVNVPGLVVVNAIDTLRREGTAEVVDP